MTMWLDLRKHFDARAIEWFGGLYLLMWGAYLILNPDVLHQAPSIFDGLIVWLDQEVWALTAFTAGMIRLVALFINGKWGLTPLIRVVTSFMSVFVWFWVCVGLFQAPLMSPSITIYVGLMLADIYSSFRAASDAYEAMAMEKLHKRSEMSRVPASRDS